MKEVVTIFENEEAVRLLNYFISYKKIISKNEYDLDSNILVDDSGASIGASLKPNELSIK